jgi:hypothetical protein
MPRKVTPVKREELTDEARDSIIRAALRRAGLVGDLKAALLAGDQFEITAAARRVCGLKEELEQKQ